MQRSLDQIGKDWCEEEGFERFLVDLRIAEVKPRCYGSSLLDVGCGTGLLCRAFENDFKRIVGVDGSDWKIRKARDLTKASNIDYIHSYFESFQPGGRFDTIVMTNVLEHVDDPNHILKLAKNWLTPKGVIMATVPNALGLHKRIGLKMGMIESLYTLTDDDISKGHQRIYDPEAFKTEFTTAGFQITALSGIFLKPLSGKQMMEFDPGFMNAYYELGKELPEYCSSLLVTATHS